MTCCSPYAPNTTSSALLNYSKLSVQFPCKHVMKIWFFIFDSLLYMLNCFIFQTKLPIVVYNVRRTYMLTIWLGLKVLTSQVRQGIKNLLCTRKSYTNHKQSRCFSSISLKTQARRRGWGWGWGERGRRVRTNLLQTQNIDIMK